MRKFFKRLFLVLLVFVLILAGSYAWKAFPIISGYGAKNLCSCVYVSGRSAESVVDQELASFPLSLGSFKVELTDSSTYGSVFGLASRKAIFRKGLGCTLIPDGEGDDLRKQVYSLSEITSDTLFSDISSDSSNEQLAKAVAWAFEETDADHPKNTRAVIIIKDGQLLYERYAEGFDRNTPQMGWSMTKSVTNALLGILVKDNKLSLYQPAPVQQWKDKADPRSAITLDHLLRMSSGLTWEEEYAGPSTATNMLFKEPDMAEYAASFPLSCPPDTKWYYSSGTSNILSEIVRDNAGDDYYNFVRERLFNKLGMTSAVIEPDASGTFVGSSYMYATPLDWARFGLLYINDGVWRGERILPEGWVKYSSTPTPAAPNGEYGAHFWVNVGPPGEPSGRWYPDAPTDLFSMNGFEGQRVFILPSQNAVIVRLGLSKRADFDFNIFLKNILSALPE